jgi:hypothetical protein
MYFAASLEEKARIKVRSEIAQSWFNSRRLAWVWEESTSNKLYKAWKLTGILKRNLGFF